MFRNRDRIIYFAIILILAGYIAYLNHTISDIKFKRTVLSTEMDGYRIQEIASARSIKLKDAKLKALMKDLKAKPKERIVIKWKERIEEGRKEGEVIYFDSGEIDLASLTLRLNEYNKEIYISDGHIFYEKTDADPDIHVESILVKKQKKMSLYLGMDHTLTLAVGISYRVGFLSFMGSGSPNFLMLGIGLNL